MSTVEITRVVLEDDAQMHAVFSVYGPGRRLGREDAPVISEHEFIAANRSPDEAELHEMYLAVDGETPLGMLSVYLPLLDNLDKAYSELVVHPDRRGQGVGSALLARFEEVAAAHGRTELLAGSKVPFDQVETHAYRRFASRHGYTLSNIEVARQQRAPVPDADLDAWQAKAATKSAGYEITTYVDEFPAELTPSLCALLGQLAVDAPTGDVDWEEEVVTPARLQQRYEMTKAMGRQLFETVAVKDGVVAAQTTLSVPLTAPDAFQWGTFVHRDHRGHSLGLAVKVANQRAMQAAHPHITRVATQNAETNEWMIAINVMMGFKAVEASCDFVKRT